MNFVYDDGGRAAAGFKGRTGDCVVRSIAIASGRPYKEVYYALYAGMTSSPRNGVDVKSKWFKKYMRSLGAEWVPTMHIGSGCKVHLVKGELPKGKLVVSVSRHYTVVIDGTIRDTHDPSQRGTTIYPYNFVGDIPKGATKLSNGNGWAYSPARCVYGYWRFA